MYLKDKLQALEESKDTYGNVTLSEAIYKISSKVIICPKCKGEGRLNGYDLEFDPENSWKAIMCNLCKGNGYLAKEVL